MQYVPNIMGPWSGQHYSKLFLLFNNSNLLVGGVLSGVLFSIAHSGFAVGSFAVCLALAGRAVCNASR